MTRALRVALLLIAAVVLDTTVLSDLRVFGVSGQSVLLVGVAAGAVGGPDRGAAIGFAAGVMTDLFATTPFGLSPLAFCLVGYAVGQLSASVLRAAWWIPVVTTTVASAAAVVLFALAGAVVGVDHLVTSRLALVATVVGLVNGLLALGVVPAVGWALAAAHERVPRLA